MLTFPRCLCHLLLMALCLGAACSGSGVPATTSPAADAAQDQAELDVLPHEGVAIDVPDGDPEIDVGELSAWTPCWSKSSCFRFGQCHWNTLGPAPQKCVPRTQLDCTQSEVCKNSGWCSISGDYPIAGICAPVAGPQCATGLSCKKNGWCGEGPYWCEPRSEAHCLQSEVCAKAGECHYAEFSTSKGLTGACLAIESTDCSKLELCKEKGLCHYVPVALVKGFGTCAGTTTADCLKATKCETEGLCAAADGSGCRPGSQADCAKSTSCKYAGACAVAASGQSCELPEGASCKGVPACLEEGWCTAQLGKCAIGSDSDCAQSQACKKEGRCLFNERYLRCEATVDPWPPNW